MPRFECVTRGADGIPVGLFGYESFARETAVVGVGDHNRFVSGPGDRGQPRAFLPGKHAAVVGVKFESETASWELDGGRAIGRRNGPPCKDTFELEPVADTGISKARPLDKPGNGPRSAREP